MRTRWAAAAALVAGAVLLTAGCGGGSSSGSGGAPLPTGAQAHDATLLAGRNVYRAECATCHGSHGQGAVGPTFNDGKLARDFPNAADQVTFVANGRGIMPAFAGILSHQQLENVVAYERQVLSTSR